MANDGQKYVVFLVEGERFGLPISAVERILPEQRPTPVPNTAEMIMGVFNLGGDMILAVDLRLRFDFSASARNGTFVLIRSHGALLACRVDSVEGISSFGADDLDTDCEFVTAKGDDFLQSVAWRGDDLIVILNPECVIPSHVRKSATVLAA